MNDQGITKHDQVLLGLVFSLQAAAMTQLGKMKNPATDELEMDLEQARGTIDILEMLKAKCREGTPAEVLRLLDTAVMELQMNYLDEMKRQSAAGEDAGTDDTAGAGDEETTDAGTPEEEEAGE